MTQLQKVLRRAKRKEQEEEMFVEYETCLKNIDWKYMKEKDYSKWKKGFTLASRIAKLAPKLRKIDPKRQSIIFRKYFHRMTT